MTLMARKLLLQPQLPWPSDRLWTTAGTYSTLLPIGNYRITVRGGGGAGGERGKDRTDGGTGGNGGAGAMGETEVYTVSFLKPQTLNVIVGAGGKTRANGGNGAAGRPSLSTSNGAGSGGGGGGGMPSYIELPNGTLLISDSAKYGVATGGGGGGGGGGGSTNGRERYQASGAGGGGGGYYRPVISGTEADEHTIEVISVPGQLGGQYDDAQFGSGYKGADGNIADFPDIMAGAGGAAGDNKTVYWYGKPGGVGGGAGGTSGHPYYANEGGATAGVGGGGAGGSTDAGGGRGGQGFEVAPYPPAGYSIDATNAHEVPTPVTNHLGEEVTDGYGIGGMGQTRSQACTDGADGFVYIERI